jgi:pyrrolidone-carboxylate peptidase
MRAENRGVTGGAKWSDTGPAFARATAPVSEMVQALTEAGLMAAATSDSEEDAGSYLLYRILTALPDDADAPAVALLRVPVALAAAEVRRSVAVATEAIARHLPLMPRERLG